MIKLKCILLLASCLVLAASSPIQQLVDFHEPQEALLEEFEPVLSRHARSPQGGSLILGNPKDPSPHGGSLDLGYRKDDFGREASFNVNQKLYTSENGRGSLDANAHGSRNFDQNQNSFGGGLQGKWPQGGGAGIGFNKDAFGREASVNLNQNLYTSRDGRGSIDAYAQGSRNFDYNLNNFAGGIQGSYKF